MISDLNDAAEMPKPGPHGLAIREGFLGAVEHADRHRYHVATYDCPCGVGYRIFVNEVHYDLGRQFQNNVKDLLEYVHKNGGPHPDVIQIPMEAEFQVKPNRWAVNPCSAREAR
jgi:hypothetical protein